MVVLGSQVERPGVTALQVDVRSHSGQQVTHAVGVALGLEDRVRFDPAQGLDPGIHGGDQSRGIGVYGAHVRIQSAYEECAQAGELTQGSPDLREVVAGEAREAPVEGRS